MRALAGRNADAGARLQAACADQPGALHLVELDVSDEASVSAAVAKTRELVGPLDVVVHNAAYGTGGLMDTITVEQMRKVFEGMGLFGHCCVQPGLFGHCCVQPGLESRLFSP